MKDKKEIDSNQLSLFADENNSASKRKIEDLDGEINRHVSAKNAIAAKAAAKKQEVLLKRLIEEKKSGKKQD